MAEGIKLLEELKCGSYQAAILGSYNVDFPFFEEVVLRALRSRGCDHNVLLMDAAQCSQGLLDPERAPRLAERLYGLIPVRAPGAFHPKWLLLLGKRQSRLLVGSHNLTLSGFGLNRELSNRVTVSSAGEQALARTVFEFALRWAATLGQEVTGLIEAACNWAPWLRTARSVPEDTVVLGSHPGGACLWEQVRSRVDNPVTRITVVGPYFDTGLSFLQTLRDHCSSAELVVGIHPQHAKLDAGVARRLEGVRFKDSTGWLGDDRGRLTHAKSLHLQLASGESLLVTGSANPSSPAWLDGPGRNAELVLLRRLQRDDPLPDDLGLNALRDCPEMTEAAWATIDARRQAEQEEKKKKSDGGRAWLALETELGFTIDSRFARPGGSVTILDQDGAELATTQPTPADENRCLLRMDDDEVRGQATYLEAASGAGTERAVVQHLRELLERATSKKQRSLRQALFDLDAGGDNIDAYLDILHRALFDEAPVPRPRADRAASERVPTPEAQPSVGVGELLRKKGRKPRASSGDIGLVIDALIHKMGEALGGAASAARLSEEQIDETTEVPSARRSRDKDRELAHRCRLKTRMLMRQMLKRLEQARAATTESFGVLVQLVACLALLHRLRALQPRLEWLPIGETLIEPDWLWNLFKVSAVVAFAPGNGAVHVLRKQHGDFSELAMASAFTLWSGWVSGLDIRSALSARAEELGKQDENLAGVSVMLNCLHAELLPDDKERTQIFGEEGNEWLQRHLRWATDITTARPSNDPVTAGSVIRFSKSKSVEIGVVIQMAEGKVEVMDRETGAVRRYRADTIESVGSLPGQWGGVSGRKNRSLP